MPFYETYRHIIAAPLSSPSQTSVLMNPSMLNMKCALTGRMSHCVVIGERECSRNVKVVFL